jgi:hypothetical protein
MSAYPYKTHVEIVVASMALHNYIRRRSHDDVAFVEFNCNSNFIPDDILPDVVVRSGSHSTSRPGRVDLICDEIADIVMEQ